MWWKLNDHNVSMETEDEVLSVAFGGNATQKSACNMVYISKHIAELIESLPFPLFSEDHASQFNIPPDVTRGIKSTNFSFS